jgi:hypothetical protein
VKTLESDIVIKATAEKIWDILMDFESYPEWNPFIKKITGKPVPGEQIRATLQLEGRKHMVFKPKVKVNTPRQEFRWLGHFLVPGLFDGEHIFRLEPEDQNGIKFIQREEFRGILASAFLKRIGEATRSGFDAMNQALQQRAESDSEG